MSYVVETTGGRVVGESAGAVSVWRGIPFAAPPVGELRGRSPRPVVPWAGVRDATRFGFIAPQDTQRTSGVLSKGPGPAQSEDCLFLNVWSPGSPSSVTGVAQHPVVVWFHGGANVSGASSLPDYDGATLADRGDIVVVSANYRLGALGFGDFTSFGRGRSTFDDNAALRDAVAALEWVRDNISRFGGDPKRVTIMGESAGAGMVTALMATPSAAGLFRGAIAQSPPITTVYGRERSARRAHEVLTELGIDTGEVERLREVPVGLVVQATSAVLARNARERPGTLAFGQVVDGTYLPRHPLDAFESGRSHAVPLLIGTNDDESTLFRRADPPLLPTTTDLMMRALDGAGSAGAGVGRGGSGHGAGGRGDAGGLADDARRRILATSRDPRSRQAALEFGTDWTFRQPVLRAAAAHARRAPTFVYQYGYRTRVETLLGLGATHGSEIPLVFGTLDAPIGKLLTLLGPRGATRRLSRHLQDAWIAFIRSGVPGPEWMPHAPDRAVHRITSAGGRSVPELEPAKREAWSTLSWPR